MAAKRTEKAGRAKETPKEGRRKPSSIHATIDTPSLQTLRIERPYGAVVFETDTGAAAVD
jgi:hypothetical protein